MPTYGLTGTVKLVMDQQTFPSGFTKREFVVTTEGEKYPQDIKFECLKDKTSLLDEVQPGQRVNVSFDLRGNEYKDRYYVNLVAWKLDNAGEASAAPADEEGPPVEALAEPEEEMGDDAIPF